MAAINATDTHERLRQRWTVFVITSRCYKQDQICLNDATDFFERLVVEFQSRMSSLGTCNLESADGTQSVARPRSTSDSSEWAWSELQGRSRLVTEVNIPGFAKETMLRTLESRMFYKKSGFER